MNRKQKRQLDRENKKEKPGKARAAAKNRGSPPEAGPVGEKRRVVAENGKILIVDAIGNVYLEEEDEEGNTQQFFLDLDEIPKPTVKDTALYRVPIWLYHKATSRFRKAEAEPEDAELPEITVSDSSQEHDSGFEVVSKDNPVDSMAQANGTARKRGKKGRS